jgi:hypothetical protein
LIPLTAGSIGLPLRQVCSGALCSNPERPTLSISMTTKKFGLRSLLKNPACAKMG